MDKQREAFEKWVQINIKKEFDPIDINDCYKAWQAAIALQQAEIARLERIIKDQRLLFDAREAGLEKIIREFKENT